MRVNTQSGCKVTKFFWFNNHFCTTISQNSINFAFFEKKTRKSFFFSRKMCYFAENIVLTVTYLEIITKTNNKYENKSIEIVRHWINCPWCGYAAAGMFLLH